MADVNIVDKLLSFTLLGSEWVLWLLLGLSVISIAIILERSVYFLRTRINMVEFSTELTDHLAKDDVDGIKKLCTSSESIEAKVALKGVDFAARSPQSMEDGMSGLLIGQKQKLDQGLVVLGTLGNNAPFIGLFGTVIGIIQAFHDLASNPAGGPSVVMAGISEALVATAVGLVVAIPAVVAYNGFLRVVKQRIANAEAIKKLIVSHYSK